MTTYMFPGQGSQFKGMGKGLFDQFPHLTQKADAILGYSIEELCLQDPNKYLQQTCYTQPALYTVNALTYFSKHQATGKSPDFVAGHSLGEYNALLAAEVFDFETGLKLVQKRGALMNMATGGAMAAILGIKIDAVKRILDLNDLGKIAIANHNSHTQIVLSGAKDDIANIQPLFEHVGAMVVPLQVSGAFHSSFMQSAQDQFAAFLEQFEFHPPILPVFSNYTARPYLASYIAANLAKQITHTVRWTETIEYLRSQGETTFEEVGPGSVLSGLIQRIQKDQ